ncbi:hypothetical protein PRZ48_003419 [Zasmidium cellare]|uniref:Large ribosomal subunit protein mL44 n=1 Tax=Zasmidium cellare TaxID=395010 RepID=A0ABR0EV00_ZASCE|nr:hypothetical protein PRZ48_003419 [Zasmidium cellare]
MKTLRLDRWASQLQPPRNPRLYLLAQRCPFSTRESTPRRHELQRRQHQIQTRWQPKRRDGTSRRQASSAAAVAEDEVEYEESPKPNFPTHKHATRSTKLSALHARLSLPTKLPLQTLARCLIDPSVDPRPGYNNAPLAILGQELLGYYTSEHIICHYPRLPMPVLFAAQYAYVGPPTLAAMRTEWGVEHVAAPGPEVDPGLLQLKRMEAGNAMAEDGTQFVKDLPAARRLGSGRRNDQFNYRRGYSSRIVYDDQFGDLHTGLKTLDDLPPFTGAPQAEASEGSEDLSTFTPQDHPVTMDTDPVTVEAASAGFVRALTGAVYLHAGTAAAKAFHRAHVLSRHLKLHELFHFTHPTRDLSRLCAREEFEPPVARLISETGRLSGTPVFVVGVFSGDDKLGEGAGVSLNEARVRAAAAALRSWYLYSPREEDIVVPSDVEGESKKKWKPQMIDMGEIVT